MRHTTSLQDKVYQPFKQKKKKSDREIYFIMHSEQCEVNLCFWHSVFHVRDWIQQSPWQTAGKLMRLELLQRNQLMETSRWGALWPKVTSITKLRHTKNSFEVQDFMLISCCRELIIIPTRRLKRAFLYTVRTVLHILSFHCNVFICLFGCFVLFFFCHRTLCLEWVISLWWVQRAGRFPVPTVPPKTTCPCWREWWM